ncbi:hypothetical protein [Priestia megaterium]|jgi:hypothetical protein|uniref:hypothetical protein n=1 Tax=Priestia megaterium TaxID=1404 RepID=UPI000BEC721D|nr:hypothetical protein [Priestia megaterium]MED4064417.1 hypothetical protein [Priestia megaterium]PEA38460.1 hypothetical protein CON45_12695 [Priestia megaterium]
MLNKLKNYQSSKGGTVNEYLQQKHPDGKWIEKDNELIYEAKVAHLPVKYRWQIIDGQFEASSGKSISLTPLLNKRNREIAARREQLSEKELEIYDFIKQDSEGDDEVIKESFKKASEKFDVSEEEAEEIFIKVDNWIYQTS